MNDNTVYDYPLIEQCNQKIKTGVANMVGIAETFEKEVKKLVSDTWGGTAAQEYERAANSIQNSMQEKSHVLDRLGKKNADNAELMKDIDKKGQTAFSGIG